MFLTEEEIATLTGKKMKSRQVEQLRRMGIAFYVNGGGRPVVCRSAVEGGKPASEVKKARWQPNVLKAVNG
jgi:hypothetical protein